MVYSLRYVQKKKTTHLYRRKNYRRIQERFARHCLRTKTQLIRFTAHPCAQNNRQLNETNVCKMKQDRPLFEGVR